MKKNIITKITNKVQGIIPCTVSKFPVTNSLVTSFELLLSRTPSLEEWQKIRRKIGFPILIGKSRKHITVFI